MTTRTPHELAVLLVEALEEVLDCVDNCCNCWRLGTHKERQKEVDDLIASAQALRAQSLEYELAVEALEFIKYECDHECDERILPALNKALEALRAQKPVDVEAVYKFAFETLSGDDDGSELDRMYNGGIKDTVNLLSTKYNLTEKE